MSTLLELMLVVNSTVLVLSMNVAAIVIQIASTRFSSQVSTIFFQSYFLMFCLFLFLFNNLNTLVRCRSVHCGARCIVCVHRQSVHLDEMLWHIKGHGSRH